MSSVFTPQVYHPLSAQWPTLDRVETDFATINGHRLRYRLAGRGPLVVFGHGLLGSIEQLDEQATTLRLAEERVRLLVYDARGHGQSEGPDDPAHYSWETLGRDMAAFVEHAGEESAILGGGSMGAATALWVALEQPERVRALVLAIPPPLGYDAAREAAEKQALQALELLSHAVKNFGLETTIGLAKSMPGFAENPADAEERAAWLRKQNPLALLHAIQGLVKSPFHDPETYRQIKVPTLVIAHEGDGLHPMRAAQLLKDTIPDCALISGPTNGYWWSHQDELRVELEAFLDRLG
jgi:3-oxoadipate enol-lactonase